MRKIFTFYLLSISTLLIITDQVVAAPPLSTSGRWIVDGYDRRVKLTCVNWTGHMEVMVVEGLNKKPLDDISKSILLNGFNCVRLTWAIYMVTDKSLENVTVRQSLERNGLSDSISGLEKNNPSIVDLPLLKAYQEVVTNLAKNNVLIILDNHVSKPGWCCDADDSNAFFSDSDFDPTVWLHGLSRMALLFRSIPNVVGMSLRNELRGPRSNIDDWYKYMEDGAEIVHVQNPDVLVILSGLNFDLDLSFLRDRPVSVNLAGKLMFEKHWYGFSDGSAWVDGNMNDVCGRITGQVMDQGGFLMGRGFPLFMSEFGIDQSGNNVNDYRYIDCFLAMAAEHDWDWSMWSYGGSYYLREGVVDTEENFGVVTKDWASIRNPDYIRRLHAIQPPFQGPEVGNADPVKVIFHPQTGLLVALEGASSPTSWEYTLDRNLKIKGTTNCLGAQGVRKPVKVGPTCNDKRAKWLTLSDSGMHVAASLFDPNDICLDVESNQLVTNYCKCLSGDKEYDPSSQWFKLIDSYRITEGQGNNVVLPNATLLLT